MQKNMKIDQMAKVPDRPISASTILKDIASVISKCYYCIPNWCRMHPFDHFDGMGGCWGISSGQVLTGGEQYCLNCEHYKNNVSPPKEPEKA